MVKAATGEIVDEEALGEPPISNELFSRSMIDSVATGGGDMHTSVSGVADYLATSDSHALRLAREAIRDLCPIPIAQAPPSGSTAAGTREVVPPLYPTEDLNAIVPADPRQTYDPREIIARLVDGSEFREFKKEFGKTIITGFAEVHGYT